MKKHIVTVLILIILSSSFVNPVYGDDLKKSILFLQSYDSQNIWTRDQSEGFYNEIENQRSNVLVYEEFMDTKRYRTDEHVDNFKDYLLEKYADKQFSVIVTADNNAFNFVKNSNLEMFKDVPVVFTGLNPDGAKMNIPENYIGKFEEINIKGTLDYISKIHPKDSKILILSDETATGQAIVKDIENSMNTFEGEQEVELFMASSLDEIEVKLHELHRRDAILFILFNGDDTGNSYTYNEGLRQVYLRSEAPIYGMWSFYLGHGIVGGYLTDGYAYGQLAAQNVVSILKGQTIDNSLFESVQPELAFDYKELKKFDLETIPLPNEAVVINRPTDRYRKIMPIVLAITIVVSMLTIIMAQWYLNRKERTMNLLLEEEKNRLSEMVGEDINQQIRRKTRALDEAEDKISKLETQLEAENQKLNRLRLEVSKAKQSMHEDFLKNKLLNKQFVEMDIHKQLMNVLGKGLQREATHVREIRTDVEVSLNRLLELEKAYQNGTMKREDFEGYVSIRKISDNRIQEQIEAIINEENQISHMKMIMESEEGKEGIQEIVEQIVELVTLENQNRNVGFEMNVPADLIVNRPCYIAYITMQLVSNSILHGFDVNDQGLISIDMAIEENLFKIIIEDDGKGMDIDQLEHATDVYYTTKGKDSTSGLGLHNVKYIVEDILKGKVEIDSEKYAGTRVAVTVPKMEVRAYE